MKIFKYLLTIILSTILLTGTVSAMIYIVDTDNGTVEEMMGAAPRVLKIRQGGTSTSTAPSQGELLIGNSGGTYDFISSSTLGGASVGESWVINANGNLAPSSSLHVTPFSNNTKDLGVFGFAWNNLFVSSTSFLNSVTSTMISPWENNVSSLGFFGNAWSDIFSSGTAWLTDVEGVDASEIDIALGGGSPTVDQMQEYLDNTGSSGFFLGGEITDGGSGTVDVAAGEGFIRTTNDDNAPLQSFKWAASSTVAVTDNTTQYIYVDDDGVISLSTNEFLETPDKIKIGVVTDEGAAIESTFNLGVRLQESIAQAGRFIRRVLGISRDTRRGGLIFGESGDANRDVTMTTGALWWGRTEYTMTAFDTSGADTFDAYILNAKQFTATSSWDNLNYDNAGTLTEMTNNRWANLFFYIEPDDTIMMVYGRAQFVTEASAMDEAVPSTGLPTRITETGVLTSRFTFQKSANTATIESAFDTIFASSGVVDHGNLAGLSDDDHTQYLLIDGTRAMTGGILPTGNDALSIGAYGTAWKDIFVSGTAYISSIIGNGINLAPTNGFLAFPSTVGAGTPRFFIRSATGNDASFELGEGSATTFIFRADHGVDQGILAVGDAIGNQLILTNRGTNDGEDHDHAVQTNPTFFIHSDTSPNTANDQWISFHHDKTDGRIKTGKGNVTIGTGNDSHTLTTPNDLFVTGRLEVDGNTFFDGNVFIPDTKELILGSGNDVTFGYETSQDTNSLLLGLSVDSNGFIITQVGDLETNFGIPLQTNPTIFVHSANEATSSSLSMTHNQTDAVFESQLGNISFATNTADSHGLIDGDDVFIGGKLEVNGVTYHDGSVKFTSDATMNFGNSDEIGLSYRSNAGALYVRMANTSKSFFIVDNAHVVTNFSHGNQTNPTFFVQSANATINEYVSFAHDQTDGVIGVGTGNIIASTTAFVGSTNGSTNNATDLGQYGKAWKDIFVSSTAFIGETRLDGKPNTDHTAEGTTTNDIAAGESITVMDLVYLKSSDGEWWKTDADVAATASGMLSISLETKTNGNAMKVALPGSFVRDDTWAWAIGDILYIDQSDGEGKVTSTAPIQTDNVVRVVGYAVTADIIYFNPESGYITLN